MIRVIHILLLIAIAAIWFLVGYTYHRNPAPKETIIYEEVFPTHNPFTWC